MKLEKKNLSLSRREFLTGIGAGLVLGSTKSHSSSDSNYDVSYLWHPSFHAVAEYREDVGRLLGPGVKKDLHIVKGGSGNYGLIYDRDGNRESSIDVASAHSRILRRGGLESAIALRDEGYEELYNVSYGLGPNKAELIKNFDTVYRLLGGDLGKDLVVEETPSGNFALVYRRRGDFTSTRKASERHRKILRRANGGKISASFTREQNNDVVYSESTYLDSKHSPRDVAKKSKPIQRKPSRPKRTPPTTAASNLEAQIERLIGDYRRRGIIARDEKTSWSVYDFTADEKLVSINENDSMQAASMIKPLAALAFFHRVKKGDFRYGPKSKRHMERMIQRSSNPSTNWVIDQVGGPAEVNRILNREYGGIFDNTQVVERIPSGGRTYRNKASARDYSRFLFALWNGNLPYSRELRRLMALPGRDRIYTGARRVPNGTLVYNKTGSTARLCGDMGILLAKGRDGKRYPYTLIATIEKGRRTSQYGQWIGTRGNVIREVSNLVYTEMKKRHNLI